MKDILTRLTESIGDSIARNINHNILDSLNEGAVDYSSIDFNDFITALSKDDKALADKVKKFIDSNKDLKKKKPQRRSSSSSYSSCGNEGGSRGCGGSYSRSRSSWGSGCGYSGHSRSAC